MSASIIAWTPWRLPSCGSSEARYCGLLRDMETPRAALDKGLLHGGGRQADVCDDDPVVYSWAARQLQGTRGGRGRCHVALDVSIRIYKLARWTLCAAPGQGSGLGLERGVLVGAAGLPGGAGRGKAGGERGEAGEQGCDAAVERGDECGEAALEADAGRGAPVADLQTAIRVDINV